MQKTLVVKRGHQEKNRERKEKSKATQSDYKETVERDTESEKDVDSDCEDNDADDAFYNAENAESSKNSEGVEEQKRKPVRIRIEDFTSDNSQWLILLWRPCHFWTFSGLMANQIQE